MTTNQVTETKDMNRNPDGKGGFADHPENRSDGGWKKEDSISYQYNKLMRLPFKELEAFEPETVAQKIALQRVKTAITNEGLNDTKEITDRTEGKAPQYIGLGNPADAKKVLVEFIHGTDPTGQDSNT